MLTLDSIPDLVRHIIGYFNSYYDKFAFCAVSKSAYMAAAQIRSQYWTIGDVAVDAGELTMARAIIESATAKNIGARNAQRIHVPKDPTALLLTIARMAPSCAIVMNQSDILYLARVGRIANIKFNIVKGKDFTKDFNYDMPNLIIKSVFNAAEPDKMRPFTVVIVDGRKKDPNWKSYRKSNIILSNKYEGCFMRLVKRMDIVEYIPSFAHNYTIMPQYHNWRQLDMANFVAHKTVLYIPNTSMKINVFNVTIHETVEAFNAAATGVFISSRPVQKKKIICNQMIYYLYELRQSDMLHIQALKEQIRTYTKNITVLVICNDITHARFRILRSWHAACGDAQMNYHISTVKSICHVFNVKYENLTDDDFIMLFGCCGHDRWSMTTLMARWSNSALTLEQRCQFMGINIVGE